MITTDQQFQTTLERIVWFQRQAGHLRRTEPNPANYRAAVSGFLAEIDRMQLEVREYLSLHPTETAGAA
jgi:hypothetical protein